MTPLIAADPDNGPRVHGEKPLISLQSGLAFIPGYDTTDVLDIVW